jgi:NAD-dependent dihydropyrimidine dehydrogenase PreA subunit
MVRDVVSIDREKCNGCGLCVTGCHEGALQVIDGKAVLISELMCDGLGACIGECPEGAITVEKREAEAYDEVLVMEGMIPKGRNTVLAHLKHLQDHREFGFLKQGIRYLREHADGAGFDVEDFLDEFTAEPAPLKPVQQTISVSALHQAHQHSGCPGSQSRTFAKNTSREEPLADQASALTHWPVQLHLINPTAGQFRNADLLLAADCVAFSLGNFHQRWLKGKTLAIACPKLDSNKEVYIQKLSTLIDQAEVNTITVMIMEVPCCGGLLQMARMALGNATRKVPVKVVKVGIQGEIINEQWT